MARRGALILSDSEGCGLRSPRLECQEADATTASTSTPSGAMFLSSSGGNRCRSTNATSGLAGSLLVITFKIEIQVTLTVTTSTLPASSNAQRAPAPL
jgi:hypothetical protein